MKICPVCQTKYEDEALEKCPKDDAVLETEETTAGKTLPESAAASPDVPTGDLDPKAVEEEQQKQEEQAEVPDADVNLAPGAPLPGDETETEASDDSGPPASSPPPPSSPAPKKKSHKAVTIVAICSAVIIAAGIAVGLYFWITAGYYATVHIDSSPIGSSVLIDGKKVGQSPMKLKLKKGKYTVTIESPGYEPVEELVEVSDDEHVHIKKLVPISN